MIAIDAAVDHADAVTGAGEAKRLRGTRIGQRQVRIERGLRGRYGRGGGGVGAVVGGGGEVGGGGGGGEVGGGAVGVLGRIPPPPPPPPHAVNATASAEARTVLATSVFFILSFPLTNPWIGPNPGPEYRFYTSR